MDFFFTCIHRIIGLIETGEKIQTNKPKQNSKTQTGRKRQNLTQRRKQPLLEGENKHDFKLISQYINLPDYIYFLAG